MNINFKKILKKFGENYDFIYDAQVEGKEVAGYHDALNYFDDMMDNNTFFVDFIRKLVDIRGDFFSSDREIVALMFALEDLGLLDAIESGKIEESKKSLKERKKFLTGEDVIAFLKKYNYKKSFEEFDQKRDYATVTYAFISNNYHAMRPQTPYVEFTVDADNDAFIFGKFYTEGRKGYSTEFDSVEDLEYFINNAVYSYIEESKKAKKSMKESAIAIDEKNVIKLVKELNRICEKEFDSLYDFRYYLDGDAIVIYDNEGELDWFNDSLARPVIEDLAERNGWYAEPYSSSANFVFGIL